MAGVESASGGRAPRCQYVEEPVLVLESGVRCQSVFRCSLSGTLACRAEDFVDGCLTFESFHNSVVLQQGHSGSHSSFSDLRGVSTGLHNRSAFAVHGQQFKQADSSPISGSATLVASRSMKQRLARE